MILTYEREDMMKSLVAAITPFLEDGEKVIWRGPFRWMDKDGVRSNHYECQDIDYLSKNFEFDVVHDFHHFAVIRSKP